MKNKYLEIIFWLLIICISYIIISSCSPSKPVYTIKKIKPIWRGERAYVTYGYWLDFECCPYKVGDTININKWLLNFLKENEKKWNRYDQSLTH